MDLHSVDLDDKAITLDISLGQGSFGLVRRGLILPENLQVAVKLESLTKHRRYLPHEAQILRDLKDLKGIPYVYGFTVTEEYNVLVMEMLGESLNEKFKKCGRCLSHVTVLQLFDVLIEIMQGVHSRRYVHRDIKPHNFLTSLASDTVYVIDFGLSKRLSESQTRRPHKGIVGTLPFVSLNIHQGLQATPRDDLEAIAFMLIYLAKGTLPWYDPRKKKVPEADVRHMKQDSHLADLCANLPQEIYRFLVLVRSLRAEEMPDHAALRRPFSEAVKTLEGPHAFDWLVDLGLQKRLTVEHTFLRLHSNQYTPQVSGSDHFSQLRETQELPHRSPTISHLRRRSSLGAGKHSHSSKAAKVIDEVPQDSGIAEIMLQNYLCSGQPASKDKLSGTKPVPAPHICAIS